MLISVFIYLTVIVASVGSARPTIKLSFNPDETYYNRDTQVDIQCEILNPNQNTEQAQLWHVDLRTGKRTPLSRMTLTMPADDAPEIFKNNKNKRYEHVAKNHIRIRRLHMNDSARYECNCPDCEENISKAFRELHIVKLEEPKWIIEPGQPLHEKTRTTIKCVTEDFYPYVRHQILRKNIEMTKEGHSLLSNSQIFPQSFVWEANIEATPDLHNTTLRCLVTEGNTVKEGDITLNVLFTPRFLKCDEKQAADENNETAIISCGFSGNPAPTVTWHRANDKKPVDVSPGITIQLNDNLNGSYTTSLKLERSKLPSNSNTSAESLYKEYLKSGFIVQLTINGIDRGARTIQIVRHANKIRSTSINDSTTRRISSLLFYSLMIFNGLSSFSFL